MILHDRNTYLLTCSGRSFDAYGGIIGMDPHLIVTEGYDDVVEESYDWSREERVEVADFMLGLWQQYKDRALALPLDNLAPKE